MKHWGESFDGSLSQQRQEFNGSCHRKWCICLFRSFFAPGDHSVEIKYADLPIHGSPFVVKAYDSTKVRVTDVNNGVVGKFVYFSSKSIPSDDHHEPTLYRFVRGCLLYSRRQPSRSGQFGDHRFRQRSSRAQLRPIRRQRQIQSQFQAAGAAASHAKRPIQRRSCSR